MPVATLAFNLPEEADDFRLATQGQGANWTLMELDQKLRSEVKHSDITPAQRDAYEAVRNWIRELAEQNDVTLY